VSVCVHLYVCMYVCVCVRVCQLVCMCMCVYVCVCVYICIYTYNIISPARAGRHTKHPALPPDHLYMYVYTYIIICFDPLAPGPRLHTTVGHEMLSS